MASRCFRCGARSSGAYCDICASGLKAFAGRPTQAIMARTIADIRSVEEKAAGDMRFGRGGTRWSAGIGSTEYDYRSSVGDSRGNAIVMACVRWASRTFPEAPTIVETRAPKGWTPSDDHPLLSLLARPNPYYSGLHLWSATLADWMLTGNAYWVKRRTGVGRPVELWWVPSSMLEPGWPDDGLTFIGWYEYKVEGQAYRIEPADVVHFRDGFDPANIRKGLSPLAALLREVATDNEAANWTASMLRNVGVPSVVLSPEGDYDVDQDTAEEARDRWVAKTVGDRRGGPIFMSGRTKVSVLSFSPQQMEMKEQRRIPEERVSAIFGTPAVVVGLGAGLDRATYANFAEAREAAYESFLIPAQRLMAAELNGQLVPDFGDVNRLRVGFDLSKVRVLQDDQNALHERARNDLGAGLIKLNEAREMVGQDPLPGKDGDIFYVPGTVTPTEATDLIPPEPVAPAVVPPTDQGEPDDQPPPADSNPAKMMALAKAATIAAGNNGHTVDLGLITLAEWDIERASQVTEFDAIEAAAFWDEHCPPGLRGLLDAGIHQ